MNKMNRKYALSFIFLLVLSFPFVSPAQSVNHFFDQADAFFKANIKGGKVPYNKIKHHPMLLNDLVKTIQTISLDGISGNEKKAFYINAYNILVIHSVVKHGVPSSPQEIDGFFDSIDHAVAGEKLTLDEIESKQLRTVYKDPLLHFALVCGAVSCPPIRPFAYRPDKLDEQLTMVARKTLNSNFIKINKSQNTARISEIFKWYKQDFLMRASSIVDFINQYRNKKIPADFKITYYKYNWSLNKQ